MADTVAAVFGGLYFLVGVIGLLLTPGGGAILGIFPANLFHHLFHLVVGGLGPLAAWRGRGRLYCQVFGVVFLGLAVLGLAAPRLAALILAQPNVDMLTDNLLHLMTGLGLSYFGFVPQGRPARAPGGKQT